MIDRIEMIVGEINDYFASGISNYEYMALSHDELRFIQKCLSQYQAILISEANRYNNMPKKGVYDD